MIIRTASRGEFLASLACLYDKKAELTTSAFCFRVQQMHDKINLEESVAFEITTENGGTNAKIKSQFLASIIAKTQLTDILSPYQGLHCLPTFTPFPGAFG